MNTQIKNLIGQPLDRVDGPLKVTGRATYAADWRGADRALIGYIVEAKAGPGKIKELKTQAAESAAGVVAVITHHNAPEQKPFAEPEDAGRFAQSHALLRTDRVRHFGAPVAVIVAESLEQARHAASLIEMTIETDEGVYDPMANADRATKPDGLDGSDEVDTATGEDFDTAFAGADHRVEAEFLTAGQHAAAMEPHATVAEWQGDRLTVHMSIQILSDARKAFANTFGIEVEDVRIVSPFIGGGFGSKLGIHNEAVLAAIAARKTGRPVRIAQSRRNLFANAPHRSRHRQILKLAADSEGRLAAISHDSLAAMARDYPFAEAAASPTRASYATRALKTSHRVVEADIPKVDSMRAPGEAIGTLTFETAIDELAAKCGIDPVEFRLRNEPDVDPTTQKPFSKRSLARCLKEGSERFGWAQSSSQPKRDGEWLVGSGVAAAIRPNFVQPAEAEIMLDGDGTLSVKLDMTDIGTGTYTILTQVAAQTLGMDPSRVDVRLGDSDYPETCGSGGSFGAGSTGTAVLQACRTLKDKLLELARASDSGLHGSNAQDITIEDDIVRVAGKSLPLAELLRGGSLTVKGECEPGDEHETMAQYSYGAQFAEVAVNAVTGEIRLRRLLGVFDAGRILNEKTARSQLMGGMIFGIGAALMEESLMDDRYGAFMNRDFAEYHIAVNRDVPRLEVHMLDEPDENSNPLGSRGIGELGICGAGPAIANAVAAATGQRVRKFPIHMEDLLDRLPGV